MDSPLDALLRVVRASPAVDQQLVVTSRDLPPPAQRLLEHAFEGQTVQVDDCPVSGTATDRAVLTRDGDPVASSPVSELMNSYVLVNSDRYLTAGVDLDRFEPPAVISELAGTVFEVCGYPCTNKGKFILIVMSRCIEGRAIRRNAGRLRSTFQDLSRIEDEYGTGAVYRRLGESDVETHVYGSRGSTDLPGLTVHTGAHDGYRQSWCVVYTPPPGETGHAALVAVEEAPGAWVGTWTYDPGAVTDVDDILASGF